MACWSYPFHCDIRLSGLPHVVFSSISEDAAEKSFVCTTPMKTFNLAGVPSATVSVANKKRREALLATMQASFMVNANFFGRLAFETAYTTGDQWLDQLTLYISGNVDLVCEFAKEHLSSIAPMRPDPSILVWLEARELDRKEDFNNSSSIELESISMMGAFTAEEVRASFD